MKDTRQETNYKEWTRAPPGYLHVRYPPASKATGGSLSHDRSFP